MSKTAYLAMKYGSWEPGTMVSEAPGTPGKYVSPERFAWLLREGYLTSATPVEHEFEGKDG